MQRRLDELIEEFACKFKVERVTLHPDRLELEVKSGGVTAFKEQIDNENEN